MTVSEGSLQPPAMQAERRGQDERDETHAEVSRDRRWLALCAIPILLGTWVAGLWNPFWEHQSELFVVLGLASAFWAVAVWLAGRVPLHTRWIVLGAILLRLVPLFGEPGLSDDLNRYVWEGNLVTDGISPYAHAPDASQYAALREEFATIYAGLNNASISAAYPPLIEEVFGVLVWSAELFGDEGGRTTLIWMRLFFTLCDLLVLWPLAVLLKRFNRPSSLLLVWAWCPLIALEFAGSGHFDSLGVLTLMGALAAFTSKSNTPVWRHSLGALLASASIFIKILPLSIVPFMLRGERRGLRACVLVGASLIWLLPLAFWEGGPSSLDRGLTEYGTRWEGFNFLYSWIESGMEALFSSERDRSLTDPRLLGRGLIGAVWCGYLFILFIRKCEPVRAVGELIGLFLVLTPTLHPWYLAWILPFAALRPSWHWLWVLGTGAFLYAPLEAWNRLGEWSIPSWSWSVIALPFFVLVAFERLKPDHPAR